MASAANTNMGELLLGLLAMTGWEVELWPAAAGVGALAVGPGRISAWGRTPEAAAFAVFAQARGQKTR